MSKVYVVYEFYNNCEAYEDNFTETKTLKVFDSKEKALEFIKNYIPDGVIPTKEEAMKVAYDAWEKLNDVEKEYYENSVDYMYEHCTFVKGIDYPEETTDGSKYVFVRNGNLFEDPEYHVYFKEWEVE